MSVAKQDACILVWRLELLTFPSLLILGTFPYGQSIYALQGRHLHIAYADGVQAPWGLSGISQYFYCTKWYSWEALASITEEVMFGSKQANDPPSISPHLWASYPKQTLGKATRQHHVALFVLVSGRGPADWINICRGTSSEERSRISRFSRQTKHCSLISRTICKSSLCLFCLLNIPWENQHRRGSLVVPGVSLWNWCKCFSTKRRTIIGPSFFKAQESGSYYLRSRQVPLRKWQMHLGIILSKVQIGKVLRREWD